MTQSLWQSLPCGCKATACDAGWRIEAEAFLCDARHKQGQVIQDATQRAKGGDEAHRACVTGESAATREADAVRASHPPTSDGARTHRVASDPRARHDEQGGGDDAGNVPNAAGRVYGAHEAEAMFESIGNALGVLGSAGSVSGSFLRELQTERELLLAHRLELARLYDATNSENFSRTGKREMSTNLRAALKRARETLDG